MDGRSPAQGACKGSPQLCPGCCPDATPATHILGLILILRHSLSLALGWLRKMVFKSTPLALLEGRATLPRGKVCHGHPRTRQGIRKGSAVQAVASPGQKPGGSQQGPPAGVWACERDNNLLYGG